VQDRALALPPLNTTLARRMMEQTRIYAALKGVRSRRPVDLAALEELVAQFSQLVVEQPSNKEIDINPLLASPDGVLALDARVVLHSRDIADDQLPRPAIRPYPSHYVSTYTLEDGTTVTLRPIRAEDEPLMVTFHQQLSESTVYMRYFQPLQLDTRIAHDRLTRICFIDYDRQMALVAEREDPATGEHTILAVGRMSKVHATRGAEFALLVADAYQGLGLGTGLLQRLVQIARDEQLQYVGGEILPQNRQMQVICRKLGFRLQSAPDDHVIYARLEL
jgi:acetyltransferase